MPAIGDHSMGAFILQLLGIIVIIGLIVIVLLFKLIF